MRYYTVEQLAKKLGVSRISIYNWIRRGKIVVESFGPHYRKFIPEKTLPSFIKSKLK